MTSHWNKNLQWVSFFVSEPITFGILVCMSPSANLQGLQILLDCGSHT